MLHENCDLSDFCRIAAQSLDTLSFCYTPAGAAPEARPGRPADAAEAT